MNAIRRWPRSSRCPTTASMPARLLTVTVGMPAARDPCHSATTGMRASWRSSMSCSWSRMSPKMQDRVAVARLEDAPQRERLVRPAVGMAQDHVVAAPPGLDRHRLDGRGEERVRDLAHDDAQEHRRGAPQAPRQGVGTVAQAARGLDDALARLGCDGHGRGGAAQDTRHRALGDAGLRGPRRASSGSRADPPSGSRSASTCRHVRRGHPPSSLLESCW